LTAAPTLPRACGYFRLPAHVSDQYLGREVALLHAQIAECATRAGWRLEGVFHDTGRDHDQAFYALLSQVRRCQAVAVIVPDLAHLARVPALVGADPLALARHLHAAVVILAPPEQVSEHRWTTSH
jgi:hypothetical protein